MIAAYVLAFALGLLPFGRLGDIVGRTRMFLIGVTAFTIASAFCGLAPSIEWLIAARVLQGLAGAIMTPQVLAIATVTFPPEERGLAFSLFGLSAGLAAVCGPIIGGLLIGADLWGLDWRPIFLVNVPVGIARRGRRLVPHRRARRAIPTSRTTTSASASSASPPSPSSSRSSRAGRWAGRSGSGR